MNKNIKYLQLLLVLILSISSTISTPQQYDTTDGPPESNFSKIYARWKNWLSRWVNFDEEESASTISTPQQYDDGEDITNDVTDSQITESTNDTTDGPPESNFSKIYARWKNWLSRWVNFDEEESGASDYDTTGVSASVIRRRSQ